MSCWSILELTAGALACSAERSVSVVLNASEAFVLDDVGGAEFPLFSSFDRYPFEALNRRWRRSAKLLCLRAVKSVVPLLLCVVPEKSNAIIGVVTTGFECLPPSCDGLKGSEDHGPMISPVDTPCGLETEGGRIEIIAEELHELVFAIYR
ncbi:AMP-dependent synthetase and ligase superfamily protein [Dorcoceras hygrometricum]|uniref:AMP-dependent synthetase and ligase superfamily protein n=1 Tax=Dorcoceras hygrometricum TaxID=472368 RepID=A0A2Z7BX47_9LAMI|nr:AMP-dependent synthetase and ligase superfamily protein [Dorcoceras hygrometricum]